MEKNSHPIIFFDGICPACNYTVNFIIKRDHGIFLYAPLQGVTAQRQLSPHLIKGELKTMVLFDEDGVHTQSQAILKIFSKLGLPWRMVGILRYIPTRVLNWGYDFFSAHRYRWFGQHNVCRLPSPEERARFLD